MKLGRLSLAMIAAAVACGPAGSPKGAQTGGPNGRGENDEVGLGEYIASQGGIPTLGGVPGGALPPTLDGLRADLLEKDKPVKLDGLLKEWPARVPARTLVTGAQHGAFSIAVQYDDQRLLVAGEVTDDKLVRTERFGAGEDHASLVLAFPHAGSPVVYEIGFFAGKPGESSGSVRHLAGPLRGREVTGSKIVEMTVAGGYTFEASLPWSTFLEASQVRVGLRGVARYTDASAAGTIASVVATGPGDAQAPQALLAFPTEPELALAEQLLVPKGLTKDPPKADVMADVAGDAVRERVAVFGQYLTICGSSYLGGDKFFFRDLGDTDLVKLEVRDVTGDGKDDLIVRRRTRGATVREHVEILSMLGGTELKTVFAHDVAIQSGGRRATNALRISRREVEVTTEPASGWDAASYREPATDGVEPLLAPWGTVRSRVYTFDGERFARGKDVTQPGAPEAAPPPPTRPPEPPTPPVRPTAEGVSKQVFEQYRRDQKVPADAKPRFDLEVHVAGDPRPERVVLIGRDLVVFGPGFGGGNQYAFSTLAPFAAEGDIRELTARDLTGDGAADLVVRGVRRMTVEGQSEPVVSDVMFVYEVKPSGITRVFGVETGREQGRNRVQGMVQIIPASGGRGFEVDVRPGRVTGWTEKTFPWVQEQPEKGAIEPLLLPWGGIASLRYRYNGSKFSVIP